MQCIYNYLRGGNKGPPLVPVMSVKVPLSEKKPLSGCVIANEILMLVRPDLLAEHHAPQTQTLDSQ